MKGTKSKEDAKKAENKLSVKKSAAANKPRKSGAGKAKNVKDPNKPKRPASAFFVFMEEFRKLYKQKNPNNKAVSVVGKAAGDKWKSMTDEEKKPYVSKAEKRKAEYEKTLKAYNKKLADGTKDGGDSDKSKSEVNDEDDEEGSGEEDDDDE